MLTLTRYRARAVGRRATCVTQRPFGTNPPAVPPAARRAHSACGAPARRGNPLERTAARFRWCPQREPCDLGRSLLQCRARWQESYRTSLKPLRFSLETESMRAITFTTPGGPEVLRLPEVPDPNLHPEQLLVRV